MNKHGISSLSELTKKANTDLDWFWKEVDKDIGLIWDKKYEKVSDFSKGYPWAKWFVGGRINIIKSSIEKFSNQTPDKIAYYFVSEDSTRSKLSYKDLEINVNKLANGMKSLGVKKGDVVAIYMPMTKESIIAILACAKIGAIQTVIFSGYSSESLQIRLQDCNAKLLFVSDGFQRKGKSISQKTAVENAIKNTRLEKIVMVKYKAVDDYEKSNSLVYYDELISNQSDSCETEIMDSEDPLFFLYTSGTTGKPKGVIHSHGGFSVFAGYQAAYLVDMRQNDVLFWPADIGGAPPPRPAWLSPS